MPDYQDLMDLWTQWKDEHSLAHDLYLALYRVYNDHALTGELHDLAWLALANYEKVHGVPVTRA